MKLTYQKIDGRHTGSGQWLYYVSRPLHTRNFYSSKQLYYQLYTWCWETWGPSKDIKDWFMDFDKTNKIKPDARAHNEHWAWESNDSKDRIFLRTEQEFSLFLLRWQ